MLMHTSEVILKISQHVTIKVVKLKLKREEQKRYRLLHIKWMCKYHIVCELLK